MPGFEPYPCAARHMTQKSNRPSRTLVRSSAKRRLSRSVDLKGGETTLQRPLWTFWGPFSRVRTMRGPRGSRGQEQGPPGPEILGAATHNKIAPCDFCLFCTQICIKSIVQDADRSWIFQECSCHVCQGKMLPGLLQNFARIAQRFGKSQGCRDL